MRFLFLGDSITEGIPGVPFIPKIKLSLNESKLVNRGVGGDTVSSLYTRVKKMNDISSYDHIILFIGVNDVFGKMTNSYKILKTLRRQRWAKNINDFRNQYNDLVTYLKGKNSNIVIVSSLLLGEDLNNKWNKELRDLNTVISDISKQNNLPYLDVYRDFKNYLTDRVISNYLPTKLTELFKDYKELTTSNLVDEKSAERGLHLTLDGVHLNSIGANIISRFIINHFKNLIL